MPSPQLKELLEIIERKAAITGRMYDLLCELASVIRSSESSEEDRPLEPTELW